MHGRERDAGDGEVDSAQYRVGWLGIAGAGSAV
jgi:hypothetical protein